MSVEEEAEWMRRISLVGVPGSGKTTVGRHLAALLDVPFIERDEIFHQPVGRSSLPMTSVPGWARR